ncbi:MAG: D-alanyl-D-alanine carboxypeptidase/D-alanyl-D-alanine-endopeptidase [Opitutus sp.]|nr:D-alanyl-D-alanine carboxypeptidase/D-alanyl-D-alanine-endopeptidase [Opitutus sp.]
MKRLRSPRRVVAVLVMLALCARTFAAEAGRAPVPAAPASLDELRARIEAHVTQARFSGALWGVKIVSAETGRIWFEHHADRLMSPASNCKLYTGALALDRLGGDYRIVTPIVAAAKPDGAGLLRGDVIVSGRGDPSWNTRNGSKNFRDTFAPFVAVLKNAGVRRVTGDIIADATWFHSPPNGAGWTADDLNDDYGAEISAITIEDNYAELRVTPATQAGQPCRSEWLQPLAGLGLDNRTVTSAAGGGRQIAARRLPGETTVHLLGELPVGGAEATIEVTVPRPAAWFAAGLKEALVRAGIPVEGAARGVRWPDPPAATANSVKLGEIVSPPLRDLVAAFMKPSQNLETDLIFGHLGELRRTPATPVLQTSEDLAVTELREFLRTHGLPADEVRFEEGSGLSRNNLASANATVALLTFMTTHREASAFMASLPIAGVDGTLRRRMKGTPAEGNLRGKTGTLRYANSLSGFVTTAGGEKLIFSLMLNRSVPQPSGRSVREELDDIAVLLARFAVRSGAVSDGRSRP